MIYAAHGSSEFNARLDDALRRIATDVQAALGENLVALILGGGYGRGEGGVFRDQGEEYPYNDLDLTLIVERKNSVDSNALAEISRTHEKELEIDVDFSRPLTLTDVREWSSQLMWQDLLNGHIVLSGPQDILQANAPAALRDPLPLIEATHLLLNRGAGLLWATRVVRGVEPEPDPTFIKRNYFKVLHSMGDAISIAHHCFETPYTGRAERFRRLMDKAPNVAALRLGDLYEEAERFKFNPDHPPPVPLDEENLAATARRWGEVLLYVESKRTQRNFDSPQAYVDWSGLREPGKSPVGEWLKNIVRNARLRQCSWRYPREALYRTLPELLELTESVCADWERESARFMAVWMRYN